jgi:hypothetical protein
MNRRQNQRFNDFCEFLSEEWEGNRKHSYAVPKKGRSANWWQSLPDGTWRASGLKGARQSYWWNGNFEKNETELNANAQKIQDAVRKSDNDLVASIAKEIMKWGGVDNPHRQKSTFDWIKQNSRGISGKIQEAIDRIKDENDTLEAFDGTNLKMNSTITKIVSLADPQQKLIIYDGRVGSALGFFAACFAGGKELDPLFRFAVDKYLDNGRRNPSSNSISFPDLFRRQKHKDREHARMVRTSSKVISRVADKCRVNPREIEATLFMWGYDVAGNRDEPAG